MMPARALLSQTLVLQPTELRFCKGQSRNEPDNVRVNINISIRNESEEGLAFLFIFRLRRISIFKNNELVESLTFEGAEENNLPSESALLRAARLLDEAAPEVRFFRALKPGGTFQHVIRSVWIPTARLPRDVLRTVVEFDFWPGPQAGSLRERIETQLWEAGFRLHSDRLSGAFSWNFPSDVRFSKCDGARRVIRKDE